jgi:hypothetical protein
MRDSKIKKWKSEQEKESSIKENVQMYKFNLSNHLTHEAMGYQWQVKRPNYSWWDYDIVKNPEKV